MIKDLEVLASYKHIIRLWWVVALGMILGGLSGIGISRILPATYEAEAIFHASIDFRDINFENLVAEKGGPYEWTQYDEDLALEMVKSVLLEKVPEAFEYAHSLNSTITFPEFRRNFQIERLHAQWYLRYRHPDAQIAAKIVNYWAANGFEAMKDAQAEERLEPYVLLDLISLAPDPQEPKYFLTNQLALGGMLMGFIFGILLVTIMERRAANPSKEQPA